MLKMKRSKKNTVCPTRFFPWRKRYNPEKLKFHFTEIKLNGKFILIYRAKRKEHETIDKSQNNNKKAPRHRQRFPCLH